MKFLVVGAGAVGGYLGACLARSGAEVTLFARGPHLRAMQEHGLRVQDLAGDFVVHPRTISDLTEAGPADVIILGVKAHSLTQLAPQIKPLIREDTTVVSTQNGVPWWYFQIGAGERTGMPLERVDPGGIIGKAIDPRRVLGSIIYFSSEVPQPGVIHHTEGQRVTLGEPGGIQSDRSRRIAEALIAAGLRAPVTAHLRAEIWVKLLGNVAFNPISALTHATLSGMAHDPDVLILVRHIMTEVEAVAIKLGIELPVTIEQRIAGAARAGDHKTSMLQDLEAGRPLELEAIVGAVLEIGEKLGISMPHTSAVYACAKLLERVSERREERPAVEAAANALPTHER